MMCACAHWMHAMPEHAHDYDDCVCVVSLFVCVCLLCLSKARDRAFSTRRSHVRACSCIHIGEHRNARMIFQSKKSMQPENREQHTVRRTLNPGPRPNNYEPNEFHRKITQLTCTSVCSNTQPHTHTCQHKNAHHEQRASLVTHQTNQTWTFGHVAPCRSGYLWFMTMRRENVRPHFSFRWEQHIQWLDLRVWYARKHDVTCTPAATTHACQRSGRSFALLS